MLKIILFSVILTLSSLTLAEQNCPINFSSRATSPYFQYSITTDEVRDLSTNLIWQRCSAGQSGENCETGNATKANWQDALQVAQEQRETTGKNWRLPNVKELRSLLEMSCDEPVNNLDVFPNSASSLYWTATSYAPTVDSTWTVNFGNGSSLNTLKTISNYIRLVRSE